MAGLDCVPFAQNDRALDAVLQLADVSGPRIRAEIVERRRGQQQRLLVHIAAELLDEMARQHRDVGAALAQRRDGDREHRQPEVQVLAELARGDTRLELSIRRRHDAGVDVQRAGAADPLELLRFERAQDLGLQPERQIADLVEEQRAAVRHLEPARLAADGAGKCALLVAEQLGLEQRVGDRGAVDRDKRAVRARAQRVQRAREEFLSGAALAFEEHGGIRLARRGAAAVRPAAAADPRR